MGCTQGLTRTLVFLVNFAFLLVGVVLLVLGIIYKINYVKLTDTIPDKYDGVHYIPTISIIVGAIIFFIAFLGCCGAIKSSTCMLTTYAAILFIIFLLQVGLGIYALVEIKDNSDLKLQIQNSLQKLYSHYQSEKPAEEAIDSLQKSLKCCGSDGNWPNGKIPDSCYPDQDTSKTRYTSGCLDKLYDYVLTTARVIAIVALAVSITEVIGAILALCLSNCIRKDGRQGAYY